MEKEKKAKRKIKKNSIIILILIALIILAVAFLIFVIKGRTSFKNKILGSWTTDGNTIYEFKKDNKGILKVSLSEYRFKYEIKDDTLFIDFANERSEDVEYTYKLENEELVLKSKNGEFHFRRNL